MKPYQKETLEKLEAIIKQGRRYRRINDDDLNLVFELLETVHKNDLNVGKLADILDEVEERKGLVESNNKLTRENQLLRTRLEEIRSLTNLSENLAN
jgi:regulator of replication initiation timing